jgi:hypothetical protein
MIGLLYFVLAVLASPFKSKLRLQAENAVLRHQLNVLRRRLHGRVRLTNRDRCCDADPDQLWDKPTAPASPWQNGLAERLIGSIRRECLDHIIVPGEMHLRRS